MPQTTHIDDLHVFVIYHGMYKYTVECLYIYMNNHVHRALLENTEKMRKEKDKKGNAQKRLTLLNK